MKKNALSLFVLSVCCWAQGLTLTSGSTYSRADVPASLSGITYAGGNRFYAVADDSSTGENGLYPYTMTLSSDGLSINSASTCATNQAVKLSGTSDLEAVAFDPLSGHIWAACETSKTIKEYNPSTGTVLSTLNIPSIMRNNIGNFGFESLTISGDGLHLWTCNEEGLTADGGRSSGTKTTTVRMCHFQRAQAKASAPFVFQGMYPYTTDKWKQSEDYQSKCRHGVSDLIALPDGSLLVLERDLSSSSSSTFGAISGMKLYYQIFHVANPTAATDVQNISSLTDNTSWTAMSKTQLATGNGGFMSTGNFEGMCLGPRLGDGSTSVILVSDAGDGFSKPRLLPLKLSGLNIRTFNSIAPSAPYTSSLTGQNFRYLSGTQLSVTLSGQDFSTPIYTNNASALYDVSYSLSSTVNGKGPLATFSLTDDYTLTWNISSQNATSYVWGNDSFERFALGTTTDDLANWVGTAEIQSATYTPPSVGYPMQRETHDQVLEVFGDTVRTYPASTTPQQKFDTMLQVYISEEDVMPDLTNALACVFVDSTKHLCTFTQNKSGGYEKMQLSSRLFQQDEWIRLSVFFRFATHTHEIYCDGVYCGTYNTLTSKASVNEVQFKGNTKLDDMILTDGTERFEVPTGVNPYERRARKMSLLIFK